MNETKNEIVEPVVKKTAGGFKVAWWLWAIIVLAVVAIIVVLILKFTTSGTTATTATTKPDTTEEITIKQYLSSIRGDIVRYHEDKKTYIGWTPNATAIDQVKKMGSEIKTQALTQDTYIIYAKMPSSKTIFCMDNSSANGFTGEITSLMAWAKTCQ